MTTWDVLEVSVSSYNHINILCTNQPEMKKLCDFIIAESSNHFSYLKADKKHAFELCGPFGTLPGSHAYFFIKPDSGLASPKGESARNDNGIHPDDIKFFLLQFISRNGWLPYPGDGSAERFIKYHDKPELEK